MPNNLVKTGVDRDYLPMLNFTSYKSLLDFNIPYINIGTNGIVVKNEPEHSETAAQVIILLSLL